MKLTMPHGIDPMSHCKRATRNIAMLLLFTATAASHAAQNATQSNSRPGTVSLYTEAAEPVWTGDIAGGTQTALPEPGYAIARVVVQPASGQALKDYSVEVQQYSLMRCPANATAPVPGIKPGFSEPWIVPMQKRGEFEIDWDLRQNIDQDIPEAPSYTRDELRRAFNAGYGLQGMADPAEVADCKSFGEGDRFTLKYKGGAVWQMDVPHSGHAKGTGFNREWKTALHAANRVGLKVGPRSGEVKSWPGDPSRIVAAFAPLAEITPVPGDPDPHEESFDLDVLVVNSVSGKVLQRFHQSGAFESDAVAFDGLSLDMANYAVKPGVRAFGVRYSASHHGCLSYGEQNLILFEAGAGKLKQILSGLQMNISSGMCVGCDEYQTMTATLAMADESSNGYRDIVVMRKTVSADAVEPEDGDCKYKEKVTRKRTVLHFDGTQYVIPEQQGL